MILKLVVLTKEWKMLPNMYFFESKTIDEFKNKQIKWSIKVNDWTVKIILWLYNQIPFFFADKIFYNYSA